MLIPLVVLALLASGGVIARERAAAVDPVVGRTRGAGAGDGLKKVSRDTGRAYKVSYEFQTLSGARHTSRCEMGKAPALGAVIPIVYHRDQPSWSAMYPLQLVRPARVRSYGASTAAVGHEPFTPSMALCYCAGCFPRAQTASLTSAARPDAMSRRLLNFHQWCISDTVTMTAYRDAILGSVRPGDVVLDLGAGTGILSFMACEAGAARVYAVEPAAVIALVPRIAEDNGFGDRVICRKTESFAVELPEKADVMIASMLDSAGVFGTNMLKVVLDARSRLVKPGGIIVPQAVAATFCPVELANWSERSSNAGTDPA